MVKQIFEEMRRVTTTNQGSRLITLPKAWALFWEMMHGERLRDVKVVWGPVVVLLYPDASERMLDRAKKFIAEVGE